MLFWTLDLSKWNGLWWRKRRHTKVSTVSQYQNHLRKSSSFRIARFVCGHSLDPRLSLLERVRRSYKWDNPSLLPPSISFSTMNLSRRAAELSSLQPTLHPILTFHDAYVSETSQWTIFLSLHINYSAIETRHNFLSQLYNENPNNNFIRLRNFCISRILFAFTSQ